MRTIICLVLAVALFPVSTAKAEPYPLNLNQLGLRLPRTNDPILSKILYSPRSLYYKLERLYQKDGNVYPSSVLPEFNANLDFPWETTLGLNLAHKRKDNPYAAINVLSLPEGLPILVAPGKPSRWFFPEGTAVGEIIYVTHKGQKYIQEVRTRTKEKGSLYWTPDIYRPIGTKEEFIQLTGLKAPSESLFPKKYMFFRNPEQDQVQKVEGEVERLPNIPEQTIKALLARPFRNVTEDRWSPAADQDFHILPKDYSLGLIRPSQANCMGCHRQSGISVLNLIPNEPLIKNNPHKVGSIGGYDGIFTWHPFDEPTSISRTLGQIKRQYFRDYDIFNGYVKLFDPSMIKNGKVVYNGHTYVLTREVQTALKGKELPPEVFLHRITPHFNLIGD